MKYEIIKGQKCCEIKYKCQQAINAMACDIKECMNH